MTQSLPALIKEKLYCHQCKKKVAFVRKPFCKLCSECRVILREDEQ